MIVCALCGHSGLTLVDHCGYRTAHTEDGDQVFLCHNSGDHDCYERWTVHGDRSTECEGV